MNNHFDLIIVGAGMTGSSLALALAKQGLNLALVDRMALPCPASQSLPNSVVALNAQSRTWLQEQNSWPVRATAYQGMRVWDQQSLGLIEFGEPGSTLGHIVGNQDLLACQHQQLQGHKQIQIFDLCQIRHWRAAQGSQPAMLELDSGEQLQATLIVAADGKHSQLRQQAGIEIKQTDYQQQALTALVALERPHQQICHQAFTEQGPIAILPVDQGHHAALVWSQDLGLGRMQLTKEQQEAELNQAFGPQLGRISLQSPLQSTPLVAQHAKRYHHQGVLLLGDAAHSIHPLAGQGVNLGFADVRTLSQLLGQAKQAGCTLNDEQLLDRYQRQRQLDNALTLQLMTGFKQLFGSHNPYWRSVRSSGLNLVNQQGWLKTWFTGLAQGR